MKHPFISLESTGRGFTLLELLVVIAVLGVLVGLAGPAWSKAHRRAEVTVCRNNLSQLQKAWLIYAADNNDALAPNIIRRTNFDLVNVTGSWVLGNARLDDTGSNLQAGVLYPYAADVRAYRCPGDQSRVVNAKNLLRTRSYTIDQWLNCNPVTGTQQDLLNDTPFNIRNLSRLVDPGPSKTWVFIEEHEASIKTGCFGISNPWWDKGYAPDNAAWISVPADRHINGIVLSFADGHVDTHQWKTHRRISENRSVFEPVADQSDLADLEWLFEGVPHAP